MNYLLSLALDQREAADQALQTTVPTDHILMRRSSAGTLIATRNEKTIIVDYVDPESLAIPGTPYHLRTTATIADLARFAGMKTFDTALPQDWFNDYMKRHNGEAPRGVWSYHTKSMFGEFVSLREILAKVGEVISAHQPQPPTAPSE